MALCVLASLGGGNMFQVGQSMGSMGAIFAAILGPKVKAALDTIPTMAKLKTREFRAFS